MPKCTLCGKEIDEGNQCKKCNELTHALYKEFDGSQLCKLFSHLIGLKMIDELVLKMEEKIHTAYYAEMVKHLDKKDIN